jgi:acyl transferase domain-containing protein
MMAPAQQRLEADLRAANFHALKFPVVTNVDAEAVTTGDEARDALIRQVTQPVRWLDSIHEMIEAGVTVFVEVGPGKVLRGLLRQIDRSIRAFNVEDSASLEAAIEKSHARPKLQKVKPTGCFPLKDKVALVTGASREWEATALALAREGAKVGVAPKR